MKYQLKFGHFFLHLLVAKKFVERVSLNIHETTTAAVNFLKD